MENHRVFHEFAKFWEDQGKFKFYNENMVRFPARVAYLKDQQPDHFETMVYIYYDSRIEILDNDGLNHGDYYLGFTVDWQHYTLTFSKGILVRGQGPKVGGHYQVEIIPS